MLNELLKIETYNDGQNTVHLFLRDVNLKHRPAENNTFLQIICDEVTSGPINGPQGDKIVSFTIHAVNTTLVPIFRKLATGELEPVMLPAQGIEGEPKYIAPMQANIGEYDLWTKALMQFFAAPLEKSLLFKKGLLPDSPLMHVIS
jgi:hypothetical protein